MMFIEGVNGCSTRGQSTQSAEAGVTGPRIHQYRMNYEFSSWSALRVELPIQTCPGSFFVWCFFFFFSFVVAAAAAAAVVFFTLAEMFRGESGALNYK
jgi:hypothetical protein